MKSSHNQNHKPGIVEANLVYRKLAVRGLDDAHAERLVEELDAMPGIDRAEYDPDKKRLNLAYDAAQFNIQQLVEVIGRYGAELSNSWLSRQKIAYYAMVDQNLSDNASHVAACCSKAPKIPKSR